MLSVDEEMPKKDNSSINFHLKTLRQSQRPPVALMLGIDMEEIFPGVRSQEGDRLTVPKKLHLRAIVLVDNWSLPQGATIHAIAEDFPDAFDLGSRGDDGSRLD